MFQLLDFTKDNIIAFRAEGKIEKSDYDKLNAVLEKTNREHSKLKLYLEVDPAEIEGIEPAALWEDFKTYFRYFKSLEKLAIIGTGGLDEKITNLTKPFVSGQVKFFHKEESSKARRWIEKNTE